MTATRVCLPCAPFLLFEILWMFAIPCVISSCAASDGVGAHVAPALAIAQLFRLRPSQAKEKWNAWSKLGSLSQADAEKAYIALVDVRSLAFKSATLILCFLGGVCDCVCVLRARVGVRWLHWCVCVRACVSVCICECVLCIGVYVCVSLPSPCSSCRSW